MTDERITETYPGIRGRIGRGWFTRRRTAPEPPGVLKPFRRPHHGYVRSRTWFLTGLLFLFCLIYGFAFAIFAPFVITPFTIPIVFLLLLIIWAMPDATAPARTMSFFFFAFFIGMIVWPNYISIALPGLPWISVKRLTVFPMVLLLLYSVSVSHAFRKALSDALNNTPLMWKAVAALAILETISVAFSNDISFSLSKLVVAQTEWTAIFFASCYIFLEPGRPTRWLFCLWGAAIWVCAMALWENRLGYVPWRDHIPSFFQIDDPGVQRALAGSQRSALGVHRAQSTFSTSLGLSEFLALSIPFVLHCARSEFSWKVRLAAAISVPTFVYVIVLSQSRLGLVGSMVSLIAFIFIWAYRRRIGDKKNPFWTGVVFGYPVIAGLIVASTFFVGRIHARVWGNGPQQFSNQSRIDQWHMGLPKILSHPWGYGIGKGSQTLGFVDSSGFGTIDSYYLLIALEYGILGFVIYFGIFLFGTYLAGKKILMPTPLEGEGALLIPASITLLNFIIIKSVFAQSDNHAVVFMILGMIIALLWRYRTHSLPLHQSE